MSSYVIGISARLVTVVLWACATSVTRGADRGLMNKCKFYADPICFCAIFRTLGIFIQVY